MRLRRKPATMLACLLVASLTVAQASSNRAQLGEKRSVALPSFAVLDENAAPVISAGGKVGFLSSVTSGSLISFSVSTGKVLSTTVVGEMVGPVSMIEGNGRRLVAVAAANDPGSGHPATVSIIDATRARRLDLRSLIILPTDAIITPATRPFLTADGRFCLIASSFNEPALFSFDVETGQMVSRLPLLGQPSELALYDHEGRRVMAVASAVANNLSLIKIAETGELSSGINFSPADARFDQANNPAFGADGQTVYIAATGGEKLFAIDVETGGETASLAVKSPKRVTVALAADNREVIGITRLQKDDDQPGGAVIAVNSGGSLSVKSEFTPPDGIKFSRANNVVFGKDAEVAFLGSATGMLFAFNTETGELESHEAVGSELRRIALSEVTRTVTAIRSAPTGDEIVIIGFDVEKAKESEADSAAPLITAFVPDVVEQNRPRNLRLIIKGQNFAPGASVVVDGEVLAADLKESDTLKVIVPKSRLQRNADLSIQVRSGGSDSPAKALPVRPLGPVIEKLKPARVPGPAEPFTIRIRGRNFRDSSAIFIDGEKLNTDRIGDDLEARVPQNIAARVGTRSIQVKNRDDSELVSNERSLEIFGPRIDSLKTGVGGVIAGSSKFALKILGENFRDGARVEINGNRIPATRIRSMTDRVIKLTVPGEFAQTAGKLAVVVRNPGNHASPAKEIETVGPHIDTIQPGTLFAGSSNVRIGIQGQRFRRGALVRIKGPDGNTIKVARGRVRFRSSTRIQVSLGGQLNELIKQPGELTFQVFNPNEGNGVPSNEFKLTAAGPRVTEVLVLPIEGDDTHEQVVITGSHFRNGAVVEFLTADGGVRLRVPNKVKGEKIIITLTTNRIAGMGNFSVRVVNPGNVRSAPVRRTRQGETPPTEG